MKIKHNVSEFFGKPEELIAFKAFRSLVKKDLKRMQTEVGDSGAAVPAFIALDYVYGCGTEQALFLLGDQKSAWKKNMRLQLKENPKLHAFAECSIPEEGTLSIIVTKGSPSLGKVEKQLKKVLKGWNLEVGLDMVGNGEEDDDDWDVDDIQAVPIDPEPTVLRKIEAAALIKMVGWMDKLRNTAFKRLVGKIERYNKLKINEERIATLPEVHAAVKSWIKAHASESKPSSNVKERLVALLKLEPVLKSYLEKELGTSNITFDEEALQEDGGAKSLRDASPDAKVLRLVRLLKGGEGSDSDANFGSVLLWLDGGIPQLDEKYLYLARKPLRVDLKKVFGGSPLRIKYLEQTLDNKLDKLAELALTLGLISKGWFAKENTDASDWLMKNASAADLERIKNADGDTNTFEGALHKYFFSGSVILYSTSVSRVAFQQAEQKIALDKLRAKGSSKGEILKPTNVYLNTMLRKLQKDSFLGRVDSTKLMEEVGDWLEGATDEEREAVLEGGEGTFMEKLKKASGLGSSDLAYIKSRIAHPSPPDAPDEEKAISEIEAIMAKQEKLSGLRKWREKSAVKKKIQDALLDGGENMRMTLIKKYGSKEEAEKWQELETALQADEEQWQSLLAKQNRSEAEEKVFLALKEKREGLEVAQEGLLSIVFTTFDNTLDKAGLDTKQRRDLFEIVQSNGVITPAYQAIRKIANSPKKSSFSYTTGDDVLHQIEEIGDNPAALATLRNDERLLWDLKTSVVGNTDRSKNQWKAIAQILGLTGELAVPKLTEEKMDKYWKEKKKILDGTDAGKVAWRIYAKEKGLVGDLADPDKEKDDNNTQAKSIKVVKLITGIKSRILSRDERQALKEQHKEVANTPEYWAAKLWQAYKKGVTTDWNKLLQVMSQAQHKGINAKEIMEAVDKIDPAVSKTILGASTNYYTRTRQGRQIAERLRRSIETNEPPSTEEMLSLSDGWRKGTTDYKQIEQAIKQASVKELLSEYFITADSLKKENWKQIDVSQSILGKLKKMLPAEKVMDAKALIRERVGEAMKSAEGKEILAAANTESFTDAELETAAQELNALSEIEKTTVSETGIQWNTLSSRALQRSAAKAKYVKAGWSRTEKLKTLKEQGAPQEQLEAEQKALNERFAEIEEELQEKRQLFEERKEQLDGYVEKALEIGIGLLATIATGGAAVAANHGPILTEILKRCGAQAINFITSKITTKILQGDRQEITMADLLGEFTQETLEDVGFDVGFDRLSVWLVGLAEDAKKAAKAANEELSPWRFWQWEVPIMGESLIKNALEVEGTLKEAVQDGLLMDPIVFGGIGLGADFVIDRNEEKEEELEARSEAFNG